MRRCYQETLCEGSIRIEESVRRELYAALQGYYVICFVCLFVLFFFLLLLFFVCLFFVVVFLLLLLLFVCFIILVGFFYATGTRSFLVQLFTVL